MIKLTKFTHLPVVALIGLAGLNGCEKTEIRNYDLLPPQEEPEMDITNYGVFSVNRENANGIDAAEGSLKVVDNDYNTKFLINPYVNDLYLQLSFPGGIAANAYLLVSGNDAPDRDPENWKLLASNDLENWDIVHQMSNFSFSDRNESVRFDFDNEVLYKYYRLQIEEIAGGTGLFQMSEWRLYYTPKVTAN